MKRDEVENTEALIRAIEEPSFTILGHPTGRILGGRDGFPVDLHAVLRRMGELNAEGNLKIVEINASPYRLDLDWRYCRYAKEQGFRFRSILTHTVHKVSKMSGSEPKLPGRAGLNNDIINCRSGTELEQLLW